MRLHTYVVPASKRGVGATSTENERDWRSGPPHWAESSAGTIIILPLVLLPSQVGFGPYFSWEVQWSDVSRGVIKLNESLQIQFVWLFSQPCWPFHLCGTSRQVPRGICNLCIRSLKKRVLPESITTVFGAMDVLFTSEAWFAAMCPR